MSDEVQGRMTLAEIMEALKLHDKVTPLDELEQLPSSPDVWLSGRIADFEADISVFERLIAEDPDFQLARDYLEGEREEVQRLREVRNPKKEVKARRAAVLHDALRDGRIEAWEFNDIAELERALGTDPKAIEQGLADLAWKLACSAKK